MTNVAIRVKIESEVLGYHWPRLKLILEDSLASTVSHRQYEFYRHGDAINFQITLDELGIKYSVCDLLDD